MKDSTSKTSISSLGSVPNQSAILTISIWVCLWSHQLFLSSVNIIAFRTDNLSGLKLLQQRNNQQKICTQRRHFEWTLALNWVLNYFIIRLKIIFAWIIFASRMRVRRWSVSRSSIQFSFKIKNWKLMSNFWFSCFFIMRNKKVPNRNSLPFFFLVHHWNRSYIFTLILSTMKRKMELNDNFVSPKMSQSVAWLSFSVFDGGLKIENWKLQSIFKFCLSAAERSRSLTALPQRDTREGKGSSRTVENLAPAPPHSPASFPTYAVWEVDCRLAVFRLGTFCECCVFSSLSSAPYGEL